MQVSVEAKEGLERRITVAIPADRIESEVQTRLQNMAPRVKVPGFRPGKVPFNVIKQRYGKEVRQEVEGQVMMSSFYEAVAQENLRPAGQPRFEGLPQPSAEGVEFSATFEIYPEIEVNGVDKVAVERPKVDISEADVDKMIDNLRRQRVEWKEVDKAAEKGDRVILDYYATVGGEDFQGNQGEDLAVELGANRMIDGFEDKLEGVKAGEEREMDLTFPEDYPSEEVKGKQAHFKINVKRVEAGEYPELDDEFAKSYGVAEGGMEKLRADIRENMARELERNVREKLKQQVMDGLVEENPIDLPQALVEEESRRLAEQMKSQMGFQGAGGGQDLPAELFTEQARRRVALGLILSEIVKQNDLQASEDQVRERVEEIASAYEQPQEVVQYYMNDRNRRSELESLVLEDQVVDWVLERAQVTDTIKSFDEVMNSQGAQGA